MDTEIDAPLDGSDEDILDKTLSASFSDETEPLMPTLQALNSENGCVNEHRKDELNTRLSNSLKKLEQSEHCQLVDANWSLDYSLPNMKDDFGLNEEKLPQHIEDNVKGIILSAEEYHGKLEDQLGNLDVAEKQIVQSTGRVIREIDETYQELMNKVCREINEKREIMRLEAEIYKNESLAPLRACRQQVNAQITSSRKLITELNRALVDKRLKKSHECKIIEASSHLGRIPAVPQPEELPYVIFSPPSKSVLDATVKGISELGSVLRMGPAQIVEIEERPASLFVKWHIADPEYATEEQMFVVQKASGEIHDVASDAFETVYEGSETSCFVRDIPVDHPVTLRVGLQTMESAWSIHRFARTKIAAYNCEMCVLEDFVVGISENELFMPLGWNTNNKDYMVTNGGKVAAKITDRPSTLYSRFAQVDANQIIEFQFLEASQDGKDNEGIALVSDTTNSDDTLRRFGALLITPQGKIFMDGDEKLMRLPRIRVGARIVFTLLRKDEESLRINIESGEKAVTYDWTIQTPLYFAARFKEYNKWNLMVK